MIFRKIMPSIAMITPQIEGVAVTTLTEERNGWLFCLTHFVATDDGEDAVVVAIVTYDDDDDKMTMAMLSIVQALLAQRTIVKILLIIMVTMILLTQTPYPSSSK